MKIIHCADIHLDSKLSAHLDTDQAKEKRQDMLKAFLSMIKYAEKNSVNSVIIAGDLYDNKKISSEAKSKILDSINIHPDITFYYLKGNHDSESLLGDLEEIPDNLKLFENSWTTYSLGDCITITGIETTKSSVDSCYSKLNLDPRNINIVVMHGQENEYSNGDNTTAISIKDLRNKNIDYLALGHIHSYKYEKLDSRGFYCYSGCLEARGFDEIGDHGYVVLNVDEQNRTIEHEFIKISPKHNVKLVKADITDISTAKGIIEKAEEAFNNSHIKSLDIVKVELVGEIPYNSKLNIEVIEKKLENYCFAIKVENKTSLKIDYSKFEKNKSLKGEFVRKVKDLNGVTDEDKIKIIRYGFQALKGEDI